MKMLKELEKLIKEERWNDLFDWAYDHDNNHSTKRQLESVVEIYKLLIEKGCGMAANNLGSMYYNGRYFKEDRMAAAEYYEVACNLGEPLAFSNLAYCYYNGGNGLEVDDFKAYKWFSQGATLFNDPNCLYKLGDMYHYGRYVEQSDKKAFQLYIRALQSVNQKDRLDHECLGDIRYRLGDCLLNGIGVEVNYHDALCNLNLALNILYERIDRDRYVYGTIKKAKELVLEAQEMLECKMHNIMS